MVDAFQPIQEKVEVPEVKKEEPKSEDLVSRVAQFKNQEPPQATPPVKPQVAPDIEEFKFDYKQLETIKSPEEAKKWAEDAYKSLERGYNRKYQTVAEMRKELERKLTEQTSWSPERIQQVLKDPSFVQAAQQVMQSQAPQGSGMTEEEWSALSEAERAKLKSMESEIINLRQQNQRALIEQQDKELTGRYANYHPQAVETLLQDLATNRVVATREHLWKVLDYDEAVKRAYELGKADSKSVNQEKLNAASFENGMNVQSPQRLEPKDNKLTPDFFMELYRHNETKAKEAQMQR